MFPKSASKTKHNPWGNDHPEKAREVNTDSSGIKHELKNQLQHLVSPDAWFNSFFGGNNKSESVEQPVQEEKVIQRQETLIFSRKHSSEDEDITKETQMLLCQLKEQITLLEKSEKNLTREVSKIKVEQLPKKTGIYYVIFLEWLVTVVKQLRQKVEDGRAWLSTFTQRKKKRAGYWQMYKKHGTTFGLSHERTLATQTG